jgi:class 3 adenylate cyclase
VRAVRTLLFSDIVDSTKLVEAIGDEAWESVLAWHDRSLRACFEAAGGEEVNHEGDGFFVAFPDVQSALNCACKIQRSLRDHRREHGFALSVRIGVHTAQVTDRRGEYTGVGVHAAARVGAAARGGEVLASREALEATAGLFSVSDEREIEGKGLGAPLAVASVDWAAESG